MTETEKTNINEETVSKIETVPLSKIEHLVKYLKKNNKTKDNTVSFEFIVASLFPRAYSNFQDLLKQTRTEGYMEGYNEGYAEGHIEGYQDS